MLLTWSGGHPARPPARGSFVAIEPGCNHDGFQLTSAIGSTGTSLRRLGSVARERCLSRRILLRRLARQRKVAQWQRGLKNPPERFGGTRPGPDVLS